MTQQVCDHGSNSCLAMSTTHTDIKRAFRDPLQNITSFYNCIVMFTVIHQLGMFGRNGGCIYYCICIFGCQFNIFFIVNSNATRFQFACKRSRSFIITTHINIPRLEIPCQSTHTNTTDADEIYFPYLV